MWNDDKPPIRESNNGELIWGIVILAITGVITLGTYVSAAPGGTYWVTWGRLIIGAWKVLRGWVKASAGWRVLGIVIVVLMVVGGIYVFQGSRDLSNLYNSVKIGDCLDLDSREVECNGSEKYKVDSVRLYSDDMAHPGVSKFESDADTCEPSYRGYFFHPTRLSWDDGDRSLLCVQDVLISPYDYFNSLEVGDCLDVEGEVVECGLSAAYEVLSVKFYPTNMTFPGDRQLDLDAEFCPSRASSFFAPTSETWSEGDRSLVYIRPR